MQTASFLIYIHDGRLIDHFANDNYFTRSLHFVYTYKYGTQDESWEIEETALGMTSDQFNIQTRIIT